MSEPRLNVGDKIYRLNNFSLRRGEKSALVALTITKVGRKYYTCGEGQPEQVPIEPRPNDKPFTRYVSGRISSILYYLREDVAQDKFWWASHAWEVRDAVQKCEDLQTMKAIRALLAEPVVPEYTFHNDYIKDASGNFWWNEQLLTKTECERDEARAALNDEVRSETCPVCLTITEHGEDSDETWRESIWEERHKIAVKERDEARAEVERLKKVLEEALDLVEEGWSYADDYYKTKWKYAERLAALRLSKEGT